MKDINENLNDAMMQELIKVKDLRESHPKETLRIENAERVPGREKDVYRTRIRLN